MIKNAFKLKNLLIGLLILLLSLAPIQSMAIVFTDTTTKRAECTSIFNNGTANGANYLLAAGCYSQLFDNPQNTERSKELNNKTISLQYYNTFCVGKYSSGDFKAAADCFQVAIDQSCNKSPKIEEYCGKFQNNLSQSLNDSRGYNSSSYTNLDANRDVINTRKVELNTCNQKYFNGNYQDAQNCYQNGISNTCTVSNNTELDALCGKFKNNYAVTQNLLNSGNIFGGSTNNKINQETANLARCNQIYYNNNYRQAADCYQTGINNTCYNSFDNYSDLSTLCDKNRNNYEYTTRILSYCYGGYDNYTSYNNYNSTNCRTNSNGTLEIIAGVATALVVACLIFCKNNPTTNTTNTYDNY